MGLGIPSLKIKIMFESNPLKSRSLVQRLAVLEAVVFWNVKVSQAKPSERNVAAVFRKRPQGEQRRRGEVDKTVRRSRLEKAFEKHGSRLPARSESEMRSEASPGGGSEVTLRTRHETPWSGRRSGRCQRRGSSCPR